MPDPVAPAPAPAATPAPGLLAYFKARAMESGTYAGLAGFTGCLMTQAPAVAVPYLLAAAAVFTGLSIFIKERASVPMTQAVADAISAAEQVEARKSV